jgi:hypothetical protein
MKVFFDTNVYVAEVLLSDTATFEHWACGAIGN